jgi:hypothetical protein
MMFRKISVPVSIKGDLSPSKYVPFGPENTEGGGNDAVSFVTRIPLWSSNTPMIVLVNGFGVINKAPVPGGNVMLIVHEPLVNIELVPKDELVGFHRETIGYSRATRDSKFIKQLAKSVGSRLQWIVEKIASGHEDTRHIANDSIINLSRNISVPGR